MKFNVILEEAEKGGFVVTVPALDGCITEGDTVEDALSNAKEAILCYLEGIVKLIVPNHIRNSENEDRDYTYPQIFSKTASRRWLHRHLVCAILKP
jgi:predicted RNase H-like HicB family nuclease